MRKIVTSLGLVVFAGAVVLGATGAFFSDTETSTGNTFTAGSIDLKIDNTSYGIDWNNPDVVEPVGAWIKNTFNTWTLSDLTNQLFFRFVDLKPGDMGEDTISLHVQNDAWACMDLDLTSTPDNGINEPEGDAGDVTDGASGGELQNYLNFAFWKDDGDNVYENNEGPLLFTGKLNDLDEEVQTIADSSTGEPIPATEGDAVSAYVGKFWCFGFLTPTPEVPAANPNGPTPGNMGFECSGDGEHNVAQTDGIVVDVSFISVQARNNGQFVCSSLPPINGTSTPNTSGGLTVTKQMVGTTSVSASAFTFHVKTLGNADAKPPQPAPIANFSDLAPGTYIVTEDGPSGFSTTFSAGCSATTSPFFGGVVTIVGGATSTCTVTNSDPGTATGTITINKILINDPIPGGPAGTKVVSDFVFIVNEGPPIIFFEPDGSNTRVVPAMSGQKVREFDVAGYTKTYSNSQNANPNCDNLNVTQGSNVTCTITNTFVDTP